MDQVIADVSDDESAEQLSLATLAYSATPAPQVGPTALSPINTEADIAQAAEQAASPLVQIDLTETEAEARQRESNVVTSIWNAELQERANKEHRATVKALADRLLSHGVQPYQSVMDVFAERRATVFIFEVKSIHIDNYVAQTRMALGQLLHYEHTEVRSREVYRGRLIRKAVVYSKEPPGDMKDWIAAAGFAVFWRHNGAVTGTKASEEALKEFLTD